MNKEKQSDNNIKVMNKPISLGWRKRLGFSLVLFVLVMLPVALVELGARVLFPAVEVVGDDPYVHFSAVRPLFVLSEDGRRYETAANRLTYFCPQSFAAKKGAGTVRVFCLGGSTVQGRPYSVATSFTNWLKLDLEAGDVKRQYEVVNCGGISYASYRLAPIMRELMSYEPDLFILCTGHNEFLEDRTYEAIKRMPTGLIRLHEALLHLRSYSVAYHAIAAHKKSVREQRAALEEEVKTRLDSREGPADYQRNEVWRRDVTAHFRYNLQAMLEMAHEAGVPVIMMNPVCNLEGTPPFKSEPDNELDTRQSEQVETLLQQAYVVDWSDPWTKAGLLEEAEQIDGRRADVAFLLGMCYRKMGQAALARNWFLKAKEDDICPLRILEPMRESIFELADIFGAPLVDVDRLIAEKSPDGIPGDDWLIDHVHPNIAGHQLIADALYEVMIEMALAGTKAGMDDAWRARRDQLWQAQLDALEPAYYHHGAVHLKRLRQWSRGLIPDLPENKEE